MNASRMFFNFRIESRYLIFFPGVVTYICRGERDNILFDSLMESFISAVFDWEEKLSVSS